MASAARACESENKIFMLREAEGVKLGELSGHHPMDPQAADCGTVPIEEAAREAKACGLQDVSAELAFLPLGLSDFACVAESLRRFFGVPVVG